MKRLAISVEGPTERELVNLVLKPYLLNRGWDLVKPVPLFGSISLKRLTTELRYLSAQFECVTTLYDLYGFEKREGRTAAQIESEMGELVGKVPRLIAYVQRHEFEALLFADVALVAAEFPEVPNGLQSLQRILRECGQPEEINHGYDTCPSRRLKNLFQSYNKVRHGALLAEKIGLERIRKECPRFAAWLNQLECP